MSSYPADEFEHPDEDMPVGVHRKPPSRWRPVVPFLLVLIIVPLLAWGFSSLLQRRDDVPPVPDIAQSEPAEQQQSREAPVLPETGDAGQPSAAPAEPGSEPAEQPNVDEPAAAEPDFNTAVVVLNHTSVSGYAGQVAEQIAEGGFANVAADNTSGWVTQGNTVFYSTAEQEATARKISELTGIGEIALDPEATFDGGITVLLVQ